MVELPAEGLVIETGLEVKVAVAPLGSPETLSDTLPAKPPLGVRVRV
jgi:hypothetical protein